MTVPTSRPAREQVNAVPTELYWSPSVHAEHGWGLVWSTVDGRFVTPSKLRADAVRLVPEQPVVPDGEDVEHLRDQLARAQALVRKQHRELVELTMVPPLPYGEDVPARLAAAGWALHALGEYDAMADLWDAGAKLNGATAEERAAVAAALARTPNEETDRV